MIVECPACGRLVDTDECGYSTTDPLDTHPWLMSYAPTCECSHQITHIPDLLCHPTVIPDSIIGGIMMFITPMSSTDSQQPRGKEVEP